MLPGHSTHAVLLNISRGQHDVYSQDYMAGRVARLKVGGGGGGHRHDQ